MQATTEKNDIEIIEANKEELEKAARTDLPISKWAKALLEVSE